MVEQKGQFVPGLTPNDFLVFEDKQPQQIETFSDDLGESLPLYVAVLMDTSPSTAGKLKFEQESAMNFIQTVVRPRRDRVLFATFDHQIELKQDFTDKLDLLDRAVFGVKKLGTQTALYDAIWQFCDEKLRSVSGRRVLVVITDGEDTYSRADLTDAIDIAQRTETTIYVISTKAGLSGTVPGCALVKLRISSPILANSRKRPAASHSSPATCFRSSARSRRSTKNCVRNIWLHINPEMIATMAASGASKLD